jgi:hypothetical protein
MSQTQIISRENSHKLLLGLFAAGCLYGQGGTVVEVHKLSPTINLADFQNAALPGSATPTPYFLGGIGSGLFNGHGEGNNVFWMITDRGPNPQDASSPVKRAFPTPWFTPFILQVAIDGDAGPIKILQALPLTGRDGSGAKVPVTGLPNDPILTSPANPQPLADEVPYTCTLNGVQFSQTIAGNHDGHDPEDIVRDKHGNFWTVEEYGPSISKIDGTGRVLTRFVPFGRAAVSGDGHFTVVDNLPGILGRRPRNRGFEALAITPDGKTLLATVQSPLTNPNTTTGNASRVIRIISFDVETEVPTAEYVYVMQPVTDFAPPGPINATEMKISAISAVDEHRFVIDERTDSVAKLYLVDIRGATNILGSQWDLSATVPSLESLAQFSLSGSFNNLAANGIIQLPKELVADLSQLRNPDGTDFNTPQKIEGMAVLNGKTIAIANDNDFRVQNGTASTAPTCTPAVPGVDSQIMIIELDHPIKGKGN